MGPQKATTARWPLEREKLAKFYGGNWNVIPVKSPLMSLSVLINVLDHGIFGIKWKCCELFSPTHLILFQLSREQIFWEVSKTSASEELFLETECNSATILADRCGYFSDKAPRDLLILFSKSKKMPSVSFHSSPQNILVCGLRKNGSF